MKLPDVSHHSHERELHDGRIRAPKPHEVGVQISLSVHSQVPQEDIVRRVETASWGGISQAGGAEGKQDRGGASDARSCAHDDLDPSQVRSLQGYRLYQRQERDPSGSRLWRAETQFCGQHFWARGYFVSHLARA